jgi:hypothetical protein
MFRKDNPTKVRHFCSRCADVWCNRNTTPDAMLPTADGSDNRVREYTCEEQIRDWDIPSQM